jgi:hypothetical protein
MSVASKSRVGVYDSTALWGSQKPAIRIPQEIKIEAVFSLGISLVPRTVHTSYPV